MEPSRSGRVPGDPPTLLVADDEEHVRTLASRILEAEGFRVMLADNGPRALELVREAPAPPDLLLTDLIMPGMGGWDLATAMRQLRPDLRVIYMSGFVGPESCMRGLVPDDATFLQKPFSHASLLQVIETYLSR